MDYQAFLKTKQIYVPNAGHTVSKEVINPKLFDFQRDMVQWAIEKGKAAIFADTGLGKTGMGLEWSRLTNQTVLILAPLSVARQIVREAKTLWGLEVRYVRSDESVTSDHQLYITNYELLHHFSPRKFGTIWLDESSILKNLQGKTKQALVEFASSIPYRLCTTATPAPNDITEIGTHAEFLGLMTPNQMNSIFFVHDSGKRSGDKPSEWRLRRHGKNSFYRWLSSWGIAIKKPSDLGYSDEGYNLPALQLQSHYFASDYTPEGMLPGFFVGDVSALEANRLRHEFLDERLAQSIAIIENSDEQWIVWTKLNEEAELLNKALSSSVNVYGSLSPEEKADALEGFLAGDYKVLITKTSIAGFGMNFQQCHNMLFFGIDYSWESYYQAIRRIWRFGQVKPVNVHVVLATQEKPIFDTILSKEKEAITMTENLIQVTREYSIEELRHLYHTEWKYNKEVASGKNWELWLGDSCERMQEIPSDSVDLSIYSPPFSQLFVYSATERDLGNSKNNVEFFKHYAYIIRENLRITKPGRLACVHIQDGRAFKGHDGYIGRKDLSGDVIQAYQEAGWVFWQRVTIDKNPQAQAIRTKAQELLFATLKRDATKLAGGMADYVLIFRKPGENQVPVLPLDNGEMSNEDWIRWAHPVWLDIVESNTLNERVARANDDEKHICPLQLDLIERCLKLWSNPGELIFSPFAGIGSEGYEALRWRRKFLGIELKPEYYKVARQNLANAEQVNGLTLFDYVANS